MIHGENFYVGNVQQSAFIAKAESYDWIYFATDHNNDGSVTDAYAMAEKLSDAGTMFKLNEEFPKCRL